MGIFDWGDSDDELLIVKELTENAEGKTVTKKNLTSQLAEHESLLSRLKDGEQPHFVLYNRSKGLTYNEKGRKNTIEPSSGNRAFAVFTNQRVLFLIGSDGGIDQRSIDYDDVGDVEASTGVVKHRIDIKTLYANYRFYVSGSIDSGEFEDAVMFLRRQAGLEKPEIVDTSHNSTFQAETTPLQSGEQNKQQIFQQLREMDPYDFEHFVADLWEARGWKTTVSQASVDQGIDIVATKESPFPQKQVIQAKRYARDNTIGSPKIQQYASLRQQVEGADATVIVTTSGFTRQAESIAKNLNVKLVDAESIYRLLNETRCFNLVSKYSSVSIESEVEPTGTQNQKELQSEFVSTEETSVSEVPQADDTETGDRSFLKEYKDCPSCGNFTAMEHTWRKDLIFPILRCTQCRTLYHERDDKLTVLSEYISKRDSNTSKRGYYGVSSSLVLALLSLGVPILGFVSWILLPVAISRDTRYARSNSDINPSTGYWVWGAVLIPIIGIGVLGIVGLVLSLFTIGGSYLIQRYRKDLSESDLHRGRIMSLIANT